MSNKKQPNPLQFHENEINADQSFEGNAAIISPTRMVLKRFIRNKTAVVGLVMLAVIALFSILTPLICPYGEYELFYTKDGVEITEENPDLNADGVLLYRKAPPSARHILGTDNDGQDILVRLAYGGRISLLIGIMVVAIELALGVVMGGLAGYFGKWVDMVIMRIVEVFFCIPSIPVMLLLSSILFHLKVPQETKIFYLMLSMGFLGWASVARLVRGQILALREQEYMVATEALGLSTSRRIFKHLIPNVMPQLIVFATLGLGDAILMESSLSFLGLGVPYPYASWGRMVSAVNDPIIMAKYLYLWVPAGVLILLTVLAFNLAGDGLRDAFDPKMKR